MARSTSLGILVLSLLALPASAVAQGLATDGSVGMGGRVEVTDRDYALTLPADWLHISPSASDLDVIIEEVDRVVPELGPAIRSALGGGLGFSLLAFSGDVDPTFTENCNVLDRPSEGSSIDDVGAAEVAAMSGFGDLIASGPELSFLPLPAGRAARVDVGLELPDYDTASTSYLFTDGVWVHTLTCTDLERPDDAWLSIAQSFELLSVVR